MRQDLIPTANKPSFISARLVFCFILLFIFQLTASINPKLDYLGFVVPNWKQAVNCKIGGAPEAVFGRWGGIGTFGRPQGKARCSSAPIEILSNHMSIEYAALPQAVIDRTVRIYVGLPDGQKKLLVLPTPLKDSWREIPIALDGLKAGDKITLHISDNTKKGAKSWIAVRSKVDFYAQAGPLKSALVNIRTSYLNIFILSLLLAFSIELLGRYPLEKPKQLSGLVAIFFVFAFLMHFRVGSFFYWDEWIVLEHFYKHGISGVIYRHNEHFLPLFFLVYYLEILLFRDKYFLYLIFSIFFHALNSGLIALLIERIAAPHQQARFASRLLGFLFLISSLHSDVTTWAFIVAILLTQTLTLIIFIRGWDYLISGEKQQLFYIAFFSLLLPIIFGNGFIVPLPFFGLLIFAALGNLNGSSPNVLQLKRLVLATLSSIIGIGITAGIYSLKLEGQEHIHHQVAPTPTLEGYRDFILTGTQFGTVLRGLGLYPTIRENAAYLFFSPLFGQKYNAECLFAYAGSAVSVLILLISLSVNKGRKFVIKCWLLGQLIIFSYFILPAWGRWHHGNIWALPPRYQYPCLLGLAIMLLPLVLSALERPKLKSLGKCYLIYYFASHFFLSMTYDYYSSKNDSNMHYLAKLRYWYPYMYADNAPPHIYQTAYRWIEPLLVYTLSPAPHPRKTYTLLEWLNPTKYPRMGDYEIE